MNDICAGKRSGKERINALRNTAIEGLALLPLSLLSADVGMGPVVRVDGGTNAVKRFLVVLKMADDLITPTDVCLLYTSPSPRDS